MLGRHFDLLAVIAFDVAEVTRRTIRDTDALRRFDSSNVDAVERLDAELELTARHIVAVRGLRHDDAAGIVMVELGLVIVGECTVIDVDLRHELPVTRVAHDDLDVSRRWSSHHWSRSRCSNTDRACRTSQNRS